MNQEVKLRLSNLLGMSIATSLTIGSGGDAPADPFHLPPSTDQAAQTVEVTYQSVLPAATPEFVYSISTQEAEWKNSDERKFLELARKEALETASSAEMIELEKMSLMRERFKNKLSAGEILFRRKQKTAEDALISALNQYTSFGRYARTHQKVKA